MNISILNPSHLAYAAHRLAGIFLMALLSLPVLAWAHSNDYLATIKGAHGGMVRMAEMYHFELAVKGGEARVWVTDHGDAPQPTTGAKATLRLIDRNGTVSVNLTPAASNELAAKDARIKPGKGTKMVLTVTMQGERPLQTRFSLDEK
ncbi:MAG: hypothetical protein B7X91_06610 [Hydrogenophilales bacterium 17-64-11]|nr:MAG: hypothetical protein B7X91_06610 [Hydrogenophilales bacterium 17-64-11]